MGAGFRRSETEIATLWYYYYSLINVLWQSWIDNSSANCEYTTPKLYVL